MHSSPLKTERSAEPVFVGGGEAPRGELPILVGVTGHRDLRPQDCQPLEEAVSEILTRLRARYSSSPFILLSPLAEGADRLVARVAVRAGMDLIVPLPLPRELYEADFSDAASRQEFSDLMAQSKVSFTLDLLPGVTIDGVRAPGPARDRQYALVGAFIARHSSILIALWDGAESTSVGGTAQVSQFQLQGIPAPFAPTFSALDSVESAVVYHVVTPRQANPDPAEPAFNVHRLVSGLPLDDDEPAAGGYAFDRLMECIDTFNRDALSLRERLGAACTASALDLVPEASLAQEHALLLSEYAISNSMAVYYRDAARTTLRALFGFAFVAVVLFEIFAHLAPELWQLLAANLIAIVLAYAVFLVAGTIAQPFRVLTRIAGAERARRLWLLRRDFKTRYLDYRALAEGIRVQLFWDIAGVAESVADNYLRKQRSELDWIRFAVRTWTMLARAARTTGPLGRLDVVRDRWVDAQARYFGAAAETNRRDLRLARSAVHLLLLASIATTTTLLIAASRGDVEPGSGARDWLVVAIVVLSATAALIEGYIEKTAISEQVKQYQQMHQLFARASRRLRVALAADDASGATQIVQELGKEALVENGDWVLLHRARPVEVPMES